MKHKPWERQENESSPAFEAFVLYRDTRPRSLRKVSDVLDKSKSLVEGWSSSHNWVMRCEQWDNELDAGMADIGAKLERLNRDEPSNIGRIQEEVDFSNLDVEELITLRALLEKSGTTC